MSALLRARVSAFLAGVAVAGGFGVYQLRGDVVTVEVRPMGGAGGMLLAPGGGSGGRILAASSGGLPGWLAGDRQRVGPTECRPLLLLLLLLLPL